jgi:hypothetical protein
VETRAERVGLSFKGGLFMNALALLAVLGTSQAVSGEKWLDDYGAALKQAKEQQKPLLVIIDRPADSAARISQISHSEAKPADDLKNYVLCRIDGDTEYGKAVAKAFQANTLPHTAVIDKTGAKILFTKAGQFTSDEWKTTLVAYRTGVRPVSYSSASLVEQAYGSYCPSCQRGR